VPSSVPLEIEFLPQETTPWRPTRMLKPGPLYESNRLAGLQNKVPQRHKYRSSDDAKNPNVPVCFVWRDKTGQEHYLSYVNSRQFYCNWFARLAAPTPEFRQLVEWRQQGISINLVGYDAYAMEANRAAIHAAYLSGSEPFGHERVLLAMLVLEEREWPWIVYKTFDF